MQPSQISEEASDDGRDFSGKQALVRIISEDRVEKTIRRETLPEFRAFGMSSDIVYQVEKQVLCSIKKYPHPNLAKLVEFDDSKYTFILERYEQSLDAYLSSVFGMNDDETLQNELSKSKILMRKLQIFSQIVAGVDHLNTTLGIAHNDIHLSNIMMKKSNSGEEIPVIIDFGLARIFDGDHNFEYMGIGANNYFKPQQIPEPIRYIPELQDMAKKIDVHHLGVLLLYIIFINKKQHIQVLQQADEIGGFIIDRTKLESDEAFLEALAQEGLRGDRANKLKKLYRGATHEDYMQRLSIDEVFRLINEIVPQSTRPSPNSNPIPSNNRSPSLMQEKLKTIRELEHQLNKDIELFLELESFLQVADQPGKSEEPSKNSPDMSEGIDLQQHLALNSSISLEDIASLYRKLAAQVFHLRLLGRHHYTLSYKTVRVFKVLQEYYPFLGNSEPIDDASVTNYQILSLNREGVVPNLYSCSSHSRNLEVEHKRSEVWALGVILYFMIYRTDPFKRRIDRNGSKLILPAAPNESNTGNNLHFPISRFDGDPLLKSIQEQLLMHMIVLAPESRISLQELMKKNVKIFNTKESTYETEEPKIMQFSQLWGLGCGQAKLRIIYRMSQFNLQFIDAILAMEEIYLLIKNDFERAYQTITRYNQMIALAYERSQRLQASILQKSMLENKEVFRLCREKVRNLIVYLSDFVDDKQDQIPNDFDAGRRKNELVPLMHMFIFATHVYLEILSEDSAKPDMKREYLGMLDDLELREKLKTILFFDFNFRDEYEERFESMRGFYHE